MTFFEGFHGGKKNWDKMGKKQINTFLGGQNPEKKTGLQKCLDSWNLMGIGDWHIGCEIRILDATQNRLGNQFLGLGSRPDISGFLTFRSDFSQPDDPTRPDNFCIPTLSRFPDPTRPNFMSLKQTSIKSKWTRKIIYFFVWSEILCIIPFLIFLLPSLSLARALLKWRWAKK